jgi:hypothetical protein
MSIDLFIPTVPSSKTTTNGNGGNRKLVDIGMLNNLITQLNDQAKPTYYTQATSATTAVPVTTQDSIIATVAQSLGTNAEAIFNVTNPNFKIGDFVETSFNVVGTGSFATMNVSVIAQTITVDGVITVHVKNNSGSVNFTNAVAIRIKNLPPCC